MTIDSRGRRAGQDFRRAIDDLDRPRPTEGRSRGSNASAFESSGPADRCDAARDGRDRCGDRVRGTRVRAGGPGNAGRPEPAGRSHPVRGLGRPGTTRRLVHRASGRLREPRPRGHQHVRGLVPGRGEDPDHRRRGRGRWDAAPPRGGRPRRVEPPCSRCCAEPRSEPRVRGRLPRREEDRARGVRRGRRPHAGRDLFRPRIGRRGARPTPPRAGLPRGTPRTALA